MGAGGRTMLAPRLTWAFPTAFLCMILPARAAAAVEYGNGVAGVTVATALFVLPLLYTIPRGRVVWDRHKGWLVAAQAILTYLSLAVFGQDWVLVPLAGLLGGLLLLTLEAPASWLLFTAVLAAEGVLRAGVLGLPTREIPPVALAFWTIVTVPVSMALALYGLVRLTDLVTRLHATQIQLAVLAVTQQRLRAASRLREAIGDRLETITTRVKVALEVLARSPDQARAQLSEAASLARQALDQARAVAIVDDRDHSPSQTTPAGDTVAPRLARVVLLVVLCAYTTQHLLDVVPSEAAAMTRAGAAAAITTILALQLYHSLARGVGARPRGWPWTLAAQTLLSLGSSVVFDQVLMLGLAAYPAGSALLVLAGRWAWAAFVTILASVGTLTAAHDPSALPEAAYLASVTAAYGLMVYGLSRLTDLAEALDAARQALARTAINRSGCGSPGTPMTCSGWACRRWRSSVT